MGEKFQRSLHAMLTAPIPILILMDFRRVQKVLRSLWKILMCYQPHLITGLYGISRLDRLLPLTVFQEFKAITAWGGAVTWDRVLRVVHTVIFLKYMH